MSLSDLTLIEDLLALPFTDTDPSVESPQPSHTARNLATINHATVESWKSMHVAQTKTSKSTPENLSMLPTMQLDIVLEILGHLHPIELLQVSRTSKGFRELLRSPVTDLTWRNSFLVEDPLPKCPPQLSGRRWAKLLFGPRVCDECGQADTDPDYVLWRRVCDVCMDKHLLTEIPGYSKTHELNSMVHRTLRGIDLSDLMVDGSIDPALGRFWNTDGADVAAMYEAHNSEGGPEAVRRFIESQTALVVENRERAIEYEDWEWTLRMTSQKEYSAKLNKVTTSIIKRLVSEGFEEDDALTVWLVNDHDGLWRMPRLTSKLWNRVRPYILPRVLQEQTQRLERERDKRVARRKTALLTAAMMALRTPVAGARHVFYPPPLGIDAFPPIDELIAERLDKPLSPGDPRLAAALVEAPAFVEAWCIQLQTLLVALLPGADTTQLDLSRLDRATSVFRVLKMTFTDPKGTAIGWDEARAQLQWCSGIDFGATSGEVNVLTERGLVEFSGRGAGTAAALAVLVGKHPDSVTAAEMDLIDERFVCGTCPAAPRRPVLRWRDCVLHDVNQDATHDIPAWLSLSPLAAADVRRREEPAYYSLMHIWICMLCNDYFPPYSTQERIKEHVRSNHDIAHPVEEQHLIAFMGAERPRRRRVMLVDGGRHPERFRCKRCAHDFPHVVKLFSMRAIVPHLADKHFVSAPGPDDWSETDVIEVASDGASAAV
ncbi:hypothetical protein DFH06DRAFT_1302059 [Mycena polygramma]|nr:hypothetical protein DFH06DRAFT_1302059 [Mycena polygramma]